METQRFMAKGLPVKERISATTARIADGARPCAPKEPSPPKFDTAAVRRCEEKPPSGPWMIGYSIPSLFVTRVLFHAEFRFAIVNSEAGLPASSCLDFQDNFGRDSFGYRPTRLFATCSTFPCKVCLCLKLRVQSRRCAWGSEPRDIHRLSVNDEICPKRQFHANNVALRRLDCVLRRSFPEKVQQLSVHFVCVCPGYAVRPVLYDRKARSLDQLGSPQPCSSDRKNPVCVPVHDYRWNIKCAQVLSEIFMPSCHVSETGGRW